MRHDERSDSLTAALEGDPRLAAFADDLRREFSTPPAPEVADRHLSAIVEVSQGLQGTVVPIRRKNMISTILGTLAGKVAAAALGLTVATGAAASAGVLPDAAQDAVAKAAAKVGFTLPSSAGDEVEATEAEATEVEDGDNGENGQNPTTAEEGKRVDGAVRDVAQDDSLEGREKGEAVSETAPQNRQDADRRPSTPAGPPSETGPAANPTGQGQGSAPDGAGQQGSDGASNNPTGNGRPSN
jgi:hypothetical protein